MAIGLKVLALMTHQTTAREIKEALNRVEGLHLDLNMVGEDRPLRHVGVDTLPDAILMEINGHKEEDIEDAREVVNKFGDRVTIFVTYSQGDMETLRKLMRAGVRDVFPQPISPNELILEFTEILSSKRARLRAAEKPKGSVVAFLNAKGGSGSTTVATNVAYHLAADYNAKVAVLDLDIQFGDVALGLNLQAEHTIIDALQSPERIDPVFLDALMTEHKSGLDVLAAPASIQELGGFPGDSATSIVHAAIESHDFVVMDVPRVFNPFTVTALSMAEPVYLVIQENLANLRDARTILNGLPVFGVGWDRFELLLNRVGGPRASTSVREKDIQEFLSKPVSQRVRNDFEAANKAQDQGYPVAEVNRHSPLAKDLKALAGALVQTRESSKTGDSAEASKGRWWDRFRR
ncbi:MAG TPA: AAA family ATPase [Gammaproteobacteria bacterium]|nr:AAA family ATPase [Gammaproteobacteria bacterium]